MNREMGFKFTQYNKHRNHRWKYNISIEKLNEKLKNTKNAMQIDDEFKCDTNLYSRFCTSYEFKLKVNHNQMWKV